MSTEKEITSYEAACKTLNIQPISEEVINIFPKEDRKSMIAYHKLTVITRALNNGWEPDWENKKESKFYPIFRYDSVGLSYVSTYDTSTTARVVSRLCFYSPILAAYAAEHFADLYRDYYCLPVSVEGKARKRGIKIQGNQPQSEFLKIATNLVQQKLVTMVENSKTSGLVLIACDTDTRDENGIESTGVMIGVCGSGRAIVKGVMDFFTNGNSAPIVQEAIQRMEIENEKAKKGSTFFDDLLNTQFKN